MENKYVEAYVNLRKGREYLQNAVDRLTAGIELIKDDLMDRELMSLVEAIGRMNEINFMFFDVVNACLEMGDKEYREEVKK